MMLSSSNTKLGIVSLHVDEAAKRQVPYLWFESIFTPAKGKTPAKMFTQTVSDYKDMAASVSAVPEAANKLVALSAPLINAAAKSDNDTIIKSFALIDCMVKDFEDTKPANGPVERKISESLIGLLARAFLVAAGTTGEIPESLDLDEYMDKARAEAQKIAADLGSDNLGQFRLKKAKEKKVEEIQIETSESDNNPLDLETE